MKKQSKPKASAPKIDPYLEGLMGKLLERLAALEKKMDIVVSRTGQKPSAAGEAPRPQAQPQPQQQPPRRERPLYEAICADCHKVCEVPFRPTENRPVYCKECWARRKPGSGPRPPHGMPVLTPVALSPKPVSGLALPKAAPAPAVAVASKKAKKTSPAKKSKKKK